MRIAYLAAGAAGMYCGACLHDNTLAAAMLRAGEDVLLIPTYTPLRTDEIDVSQKRVWFGGINVYLQQKWSIFRRALWPVDALLDSPALIRLATKFGGSVDAAKLGDLTVSILRGEEGNQRKELDRLVDWLADEIKPDIVHLTNAMLVSFAREIRRRVRAPVVCSLAGEDVFLERIPEPHYSLAREQIRERSREVDRFVSMNRYYADEMIRYAAIEPSRVTVIPHGLKLEGHGTREPRTRGEVRIGYLARIHPDKGLHLLVDAFRLLSQRNDLPPIRLLVAGYMARGELSYLREQQRKLARDGLADRFEYQGEPDRANKIKFLQSLDVMSVPGVYRESKGLSLLEALANAVPIVVPRHGTFPELIRDTGGGLLCEPNDARALAETLAELIADRTRSTAMGLSGQSVMHQRYTDAIMAARTIELYREVIARFSAEHTRDPSAGDGAGASTGDSARAVIR